MIYLAVFIFELLILFLSSKATINSIARFVYLFSKSREVAIHTIAFLFLPGTILHELSHVIVAGVLMVHTGAVEFVPQIHEDGVRLGTAEVGKTDFIRRALIGVAPVLVGLSIILGILFYFSFSIISGQSYAFWVYPVLFYLIFVVGNTMFSSKKDLEGSVGIVVLMISIVIASFLLGYTQPFVYLTDQLNNNLSGYIIKAMLFLLVPLSINVSIILLTRIFTHKRH